MTFEELAKLVAEDFKKTMDEEGFETFDEMKKCYWWSNDDVKEEVESIISVLTEKSVKDGGEYFYMSDDHTFIQIGTFNDMSWRDFKKLVFSHLK